MSHFKGLHLSQRTSSLLSFHYEQSQQVPPSYDHQLQLLSHQAPDRLTLDLNESILKEFRDRKDHI